MFKKSLFIFLFNLHILCIISQNYEPTWASLDKRPTPQWFTDAKFGIFIHWGIYSVPAYRPAENKSFNGIYSEWYGPDVLYKPWRNDSFHIRNYGKNFEYRDFASLFKAELWNPNQWADIIAKSGAKYVILTSKHSDGYCLWPTKDPVSKNWNAGETGPHRDLVGDLTKAIRNKGIKMGFYYSWLEYESLDSTIWPHNPTLANERTGRYVPDNVFNKYHLNYSNYINHLHFQFKELVMNYQPDIIWGDATWDKNSDYWQSKQLLSWIFNNAPNKNTLVVNDRWDNSPEKHGGYITTEYGTGSESLEDGRPWEECQGIGYSFGYNRAENLEQYKSSREIIELLVRTVSNGGNLLLNIGPCSDGTIPVIMQQRLADIGKWLSINGESIYGTTQLKNKVNIDLNPEVNKSIFLTKKGSDLYVITTNFPENKFEINGIVSSNPTNIKLLGYEDSVKFAFENDKLCIVYPAISLNSVSPVNIYVIKLADALKK